MPVDDLALVKGLTEPAERDVRGKQPGSAERRK